MRSEQVQRISDAWDASDESKNAEIAKLRTALNAIAGGCFDGASTMPLDMGDSDGTGSRTR